MSLCDVKAEVRLVRPSGVRKGIGKTKAEVLWVPLTLGPQDTLTTQMSFLNVISYQKTTKKSELGPCHVYSHFLSKLIWLRSEHAECGP